MKKMSVKELTLMAFYLAEEYQLSVADSWSGIQPECAEALDLARQFREYRLKLLRRAKRKVAGD
jgi:hypothetical protein